MKRNERHGAPVSDPAVRDFGLRRAGERRSGSWRGRTSKKWTRVEALNRRGTPSPCSAGNCVLKLCRAGDRRPGSSRERVPRDGIGARTLVRRTVQWAQGISNIWGRSAERAFLRTKVRVPGAVPAPALNTHPVAPGDGLRSREDRPPLLDPLLHPMEKGETNNNFGMHGNHDTSGQGGRKMFLQR